MTKPLMFTAAEAAKIAHITQLVTDLQGLQINSTTKAADLVHSRTTKDRGTMSDEDFAVNLVWVLGLDVIFDRSNELADLLGVERRP